MFYRILRADLGIGEPFPEAAVPLPQVLVRNYRQPGQPGQRRRGHGCAGQVGRIDRARLQGGEQPGGAFGLLFADRVQGDVALALEAALDVPPGLPMPPQHEPDRVILAARTRPGRARTRPGRPRTRPGWPRTRPARPRRPGAPAGRISTGRTRTGRTRTGRTRTGRTRIARPRTYRGRAWSTVRPRRHI